MKKVQQGEGGEKYADKWNVGLCAVGVMNLCLRLEVALQMMDDSADACPRPLSIEKHALAQTLGVRDCADSHPS